MRAIVVAGMVLWTSLAWGECAWVLWEAHYTYQAPNQEAYPRWVIQGASATRDECMQGIEYRATVNMQTAPRGWKSSRHGVNGVNVIQEDGKGASRAIVPMCLPDTVDPRGPRR